MLFPGGGQRNRLVAWEGGRVVDVGVRSSRLGLLLPPSLLIRYLPPRVPMEETREKEDRGRGFFKKDLHMPLGQVGAGRNLSVLCLALLFRRVFFYDSPG